jgi:Bacterial Ig-like domain (group 2)
VARSLTSVCSLAFALALAGWTTACGGGGEPTVTETATPQPTAIRLDSSAITVAVGANHPLAVTVTGVGGIVLTKAPVSWNTLNGMIASVSQSGVVHGISAGTTQVTAVSGPTIAVTTVRVVPSPAAARISFAVR